MSVNEKMTAIADAIRNKTGGTEALTLDEMADGVQGVYDAAAYKALNAFTNYGKRKSFQFAFQYTNFENVTFPETVRPTSAGSVFQWYRGATLPKNIDFSECVFASNVTTEAKVPHKMFFESPDIKRIDDRGLPAQYRYPYTYCGCSGVEEIEIVRVYFNTTFFNTFLHCSSLKKVRFDGKIGKNIDFRSCPLILETLEHIILDVMVDFWGSSSWEPEIWDGVLPTLTLSSISYARLKNDTRLFSFSHFTEDGDEYYYGDYTLMEIIEQKNWLVTVVQN